MNILLDSQVILWWSGQSEKISQPAMTELLNPENQIYFSTASIHEMQIKSQLGKLNVNVPMVVFVNELIKANGFRLLKIELDHIYALTQLPDVHRDPFDRILIAQALSEKFTLISADSLFAQYPVQVLW